MVSGKPLRAMTMGLMVKPRSQAGPGVLTCREPAKTWGRSKLERARSRFRKKAGNWPPSTSLGWEKLNRPVPSSMDFEKV